MWEWDETVTELSPLRPTSTSASTDDIFDLHEATRTASPRRLAPSSISPCCPPCNPTAPHRMLAAPSVTWLASVAAAAVALQLHCVTLLQLFVFFNAFLLREEWSSHVASVTQKCVIDFTLCLLLLMPMPLLLLLLMYGTRC
uniref:Uncharacterized protein n=1 Tax=Setaria digitata TaxID=48799 RepID=A0A915Q018_9BILA